ncbi:MAG: hypothetical protein ACRCVJ_02175 [Clostridium sp.]|uniref:hypothetical protein n=1 Tax=Clostridium sp. TaxID=1506 RepID=UPI003F3F097E
MKLTFKFKTILVSCFIFFVFLISILVLFSKSIKFDIMESIAPVQLQDEFTADLTGDGINEVIKIVTSKGKGDVQITTLEDTILLSSLSSSNYLSDMSESYSMNVIISNISRDNKNEIIVQGYKNNEPMNYLFTFEKNNFVLKTSSNNDIVGIIDSNMNRTPMIQSFSHSNVRDSFKNYMLLNDELTNISNNSFSDFGYIDTVKFIDLILIDYEVSELPNIFSEDIDKDTLSILWQLNKDNFEYNFKDAFFYDSVIDENGNLNEINMMLKFEKINKSTSKKTPLIVNLDISSVNNKNFKISNISVN